jgi:hypothetical protein
MTFILGNDHVQFSVSEVACNLAQGISLRFSDKFATTDV